MKEKGKIFERMREKGEIDGEENEEDGQDEEDGEMKVKKNKEDRKK